MDVPWKVILAFVGVFIAGAVFGGVFTLGVSARRAVNPPPRSQAAERGGPKQQPSAGQSVRPPAAGPQTPNQPPAASQAARGASNPITPTLMAQFTRRLPNLTVEQKRSLRVVMDRAGEDFHRLRQQNDADVARVTERMYADVSAMLSPEQRSELETMRRQLEERVQAARKKRAEAAAEAAAKAGSAGAPATQRPSGAPQPGTEIVK